MLFMYPVATEALRINSFGKTSHIEAQSSFTNLSQTRQTVSISSSRTINTSRSYQKTKSVPIEHNVAKPADNPSEPLPVNIKSVPRTDINAQKMKLAIGGTYSAYGMAELLYKECAQQADYKMPKRENEDDEVPKTEDGEDLGMGEGWWHTGMVSIIQLL